MFPLAAFRVAPNRNIVSIALLPLLLSPVAAELPISSWFDPLLLPQFGVNVNYSKNKNSFILHFSHWNGFVFLSNCQWTYFFQFLWISSQILNYLGETTVDEHNNENNNENLSKLCSHFFSLERLISIWLQIRIRTVNLYLWLDDHLGMIYIRIEFDTLLRFPFIVFPRTIFRCCAIRICMKWLNYIWLYELNYIFQAN